MVDKQEYRRQGWYQQCLALVTNFVDYELGGRIECLKTFCLDDLRWSSKYSIPSDCENTWEFDCDNTALMRAIYVVLWGHIFDLKEGNIGNWSSENPRLFRGDTINSFNTLFGGMPNLHRAKNARFDEEFFLWKDITAFSWQYHTIGNFILLPNAQNLNGVRGRDIDYFDIFLFRIKQCIDGVEDLAVHEAIRANPFLIQTKFSDFKEWFYLEDFFDRSSNPKNVFSISKDQDDSVKCIEGKAIYGNLLKKERHIKSILADREKHKHLAEVYLERAGRIIENRSNRMIEELKHAIKENLIH